MAVLSSVRSRLVPIARWLAPSAVAACAGAVIAGVYEGVGISGALGVAITTGFIALLAVPALLVASVLVRGVIAAWQPRLLAAQLTEDGGGAPRLAGWIAVIGLGAVALACAIYQGTWTLAGRTAFKPLGTSFGESILALGTALLLVAASQPAARGLAAIARRIDRRWRRSGRPTLLRPRAILIGAALASTVLLYLVWRVVMKPRLGPIDTTLLHAPALALATAGLVHAVWPRLGRGRAAIGGSIFVLGGAAVAFAVCARASWPSMTLEIWGDRPLAGVAIERLFDLDAIRANVSLAEFRPTDRPGAEHPDILLITIDTVRADHTPPYGGTAEMPFLRELGARGSVFTWAFSPSNVTRRSIPSMVIGLSPNRVRGRVVGWALRVDPRHVLLAERLQAGGYETAGFMCCYGFWSPEVHTGLQRGLEHLEIEANGSKLATMARAWLEQREQHPGKRPLFLWMHILEPHNWTLSTGEGHNDVERTRFYDRSLAASDAMLGEVLRPFAGRAPGRAPIVIVTADHGEALGEHGHAYHSTDLYNSQMRVPLVITGPGILQQLVQETVSLTDLVPTIVELAGFQTPRGPSIDGRSIVELANGKRPSSPDGTAFAAMIKDRSNPGGITAIVKGHWKLIDNGNILELYDIDADPSERNNLVAAQPAIVKELHALLEAREAAADISPF